MGGGDGHGVTYKGITIHQPKRWHTVTGKGLCAVMWLSVEGLVGSAVIREVADLHLKKKKREIADDFNQFWILYRAKKDGPVVLGWRHPWEGHGHGHDH